MCDDTCACGQYFYNPADVDEWNMRAMLDSVCDKYLLPSVCPVFIQNDDRVDRVLELADEYKAEGLVYHVLRLCNVFDFEYNKINKVVSQKKIPVLKIETEYSEEDTGQLKTRIEAFFEMIHARREKSN